MAQIGNLNRALICQRPFKVWLCLFPFNYPSVWCGSCWKILKWYLLVKEHSQFYANVFSRDIYEPFRLCKYVKNWRIILWKCNGKKKENAPSETVGFFLESKKGFYFHQTIWIFIEIFHQVTNSRFWLKLICWTLVNGVFSLNFKQRLFSSSIFERFPYNFWNSIRKDDSEINGHIFSIYFILFFRSQAKGRKYVAFRIWRLHKSDVYSFVNP